MYRNFAGIAAAFVLICGGLIALSSNKQSSDSLTAADTNVTSETTISESENESTQTEVTDTPLEDVMQQTTISDSDTDTKSTYSETILPPVTEDDKNIYTAALVVNRFAESYINENMPLCSEILQWLHENNMQLDEERDQSEACTVTLIIIYGEENITVELEYIEPNSPKSNWQHITLTIDYENIDSITTQNGHVTSSEGSVNQLMEYLNAKGISVNDENDVATALISVICNDGNVNERIMKYLNTKVEKMESDVTVGVPQPTVVYPIDAQ